MNFLGVGAGELLAILLIMLVFAGPKRMIHWSYVLGQHVAKFRKIWSETVDLVQKEFDEAGVDIKLPKEPPTRKSLNRTVADAVKPMTQPVQDSLDEVKQDIAAVKEVSDSMNDKKPKPTSQSLKEKPESAAEAPKPAPPKPAPKPTEEAVTASMGAWSGDITPSSAPGTNGNTADLGTWSKAAGNDQS